MVWGFVEIVKSSCPKFWVSVVRVWWFVFDYFQFLFIPSLRSSRVEFNGFSGCYSNREPDN